MSWIKIDFFGMRLRNWSFRFFCVTFFLLAYLSMHCEFLLREFYKPRWISNLSMDYHFDGIKRIKAPYKEKFWETRLPGDSRGSTKQKVNLGYLP